MGGLEPEPGDRCGDKEPQGREKQAGAGRGKREIERPQETETRQQADGKGEKRESSDRLMGARTGEVGRPEGGMGAAAITRTGVKTEFEMRGRDERPRGCAQHGVPQTPTFPARMGETESPPPGPAVGAGPAVEAGPAVGAWTEWQGRPSHPLWSRDPGLGSYALQIAARPLRWGLAWVFKLGQ